MKRLIVILLIALLILPLALTATGCKATDNGKIKIVATIFPIYDWVMVVLGDQANEMKVELLVDNGADLHSFQASAADIKAIAEADLLLYVGGESDDWVEDALKNATNKNMNKMNLLSLLGEKARPEEYKEGMEHGEEDAHDDHDEEEEHESDEHVWLSLKNAVFYVGLIEKELEAIDPDHADIYKKNAEDYIASLNALDAEYQTAVDASSRHTILFGDRFPFLYLTKDYGIDYYAAFAGCSAASNVSLKTIDFLRSKVDELNLKVIFRLENSSDEIARTIKANSAAKNQEILVLDSLQSANHDEYKNGRTYLSVMTSNLEALKKALA